MRIVLIIAGVIWALSAMLIWVVMNAVLQRDRQRWSVTDVVLLIVMCAFGPAAAAVSIERFNKGTI